MVINFRSCIFKCLPNIFNDFALECVKENEENMMTSISLKCHRAGEIKIE